MILTITANAALDRVLFIDRFQPTSVMRVKQVVDSVGGKGLDASVVLQTLGAPNTAISFIAGETGRALETILNRYGIHHDLVWVEGETRTSNVLVEIELHRHSHIITPGYRVTPVQCDLFLEKVAANLNGMDWMIIGGSLPSGAYPDLYRRVIEIGQQQGVKSLIDVPGQPVLEAIPCRPDILKMNRSEFASTFHLHCDNLLDLAFAAPAQQAVNAAGAGDAVSASLVNRLSQGDSWPAALQWAAATSAASVLTSGTADCHLDDIMRIYQRVEVKILA
jgi:fructose-1-phosphate kinase PfkB-like protein